MERYMDNQRKFFWLIILVVFLVSLSACGPLEERLQEGTAQAAGQNGGGEGVQDGEVAETPDGTATLLAGEAGGGLGEGTGDRGGGDDDGEEDDLAVILATAIAQTNEAATDAAPEVTATQEATFTVEGAQFTALAQTLTAQAPTSTSPPTETPTITPTGTATITPTPDGWFPSPTPAPCLALRYVADVTVPDGTVMQPGETFFKTWRVQNVGSCSWTPQFSIVYVGGLQMTGTAQLPIGVTIYPGRYVNLTVQMRAPAQGGVFRGDWGMMDEAGNIFGWGENYDQPFYVQILVVATGDNAPPPVFTAPASTDPGFTPAP